MHAVRLEARGLARLALDQRRRAARLHDLHERRPVIAAQRGREPQQHAFDRRRDRLLQQRPEGGGVLDDGRDQIEAGGVGGGGGYGSGHGRCPMTRFFGETGLIQTVRLTPGCRGFKECRPHAPAAPPGRSPPSSL